MSTPATHPSPTTRGRLLSGTLLVAAAALGGQAWAATTQDLTVNVTLTIDAAIAVYWCDSAGNNDSTSAQSWAMGTGIALNTAYHTTATDLGTGATGVASGTLAVPKATVPSLRYIKNLSNCSVDIAASCANTTSGNWTVVTDQSLADNTFEMGVNKNLGQYTALTTSATAAWIDALAYNTVSPQIGLRLETPRAITVGGGRSQSIVVTFTASAD